MKKVLSVTLASAMAVVTLEILHSRQKQRKQQQPLLQEQLRQQKAQKQVTRNRLRFGSAGGAANPDIRQPWKLLMHL